MVEKLCAYQALAQDEQRCVQTSASVTSKRSSIGDCKNVIITVLALALLTLSTANLMYFSGNSSQCSNCKNAVTSTPPPGGRTTLYSTWGGDRPLVDRIEGYRNPIYTAEDKTIADEAWSRVNVGHGVVVLDSEYAMGTLGLPKGFYWELDETKSVYIVAAYHAMHCVALIRGALDAGITGNMTEHQREHSLHCIDTLREEIMCTADRTILRPGPPGHSGRNLVRTCTDWNRLREWATENSAGYRRADNGTELLNVHYPDTDGWDIP